MSRVGLVKTTSLDTRIDDLYRVPLDEFVAARTQLAKELNGDDSKRIKQLKKPTIVPWAVNQVYWHARPFFERALKSGADVRRAQVAALEGRKADVRGAGDAHRRAIAVAVAKATELAAAKGIQPARDELTQTFEAIALAAAAPETPGRLTQSLRPGGFEMLAGVEPAAIVPRPPPHARSGRTAPESSPTLLKSTPPPQLDHAALRKAAEAVRRREAAVRKAEETVARARERETHARKALDEAVRARQTAEDQLTAAKSSS